MSLFTTSFGSWAGSGIRQPSSKDGTRQAKHNAIPRCNECSERHRDGQIRGGFISQAVRKNVTLGDKVLGHVAGAVLLPYYTVCVLEV